MDFLKCGIHVYTMDYYSDIKKDKIMSFIATWRDLEIITQSEVSQKEKNKYCILITYVESRKMVWMNLFGRQR